MEYTIKCTKRSEKNGPEIWFALPDFWSPLSIDEDLLELLRTFEAEVFDALNITKSHSDTGTTNNVKWQSSSAWYDDYLRYGHDHLWRPDQFSAEVAILDAKGDFKDLVFGGKKRETPSLFALFQIADKLNLHEPYEVCEDEESFLVGNINVGLKTYKQTFPKEGTPAGNPFRAFLRYVYEHDNDPLFDNQFVNNFDSDYRGYYESPETFLKEYVRDAELLSDLFSQRFFDYIALAHQVFFVDNYATFVDDKKGPGGFVFVNADIDELLTDYQNENC
jgi:hypothetical protein